MTTQTPNGRHHGGPPASHEGREIPHTPVTDPERIPYGHGQARPRRSSDTERHNRTSSVDGSSRRQNGISLPIAPVARVFRVRVWAGVYVRVGPSRNARW
jgi:hypothetical protein